MEKPILAKSGDTGASFVTMDGAVAQSGVQGDQAAAPFAFRMRWTVMADTRV